MGFLSGSVSFDRFRITADPTDAFGEKHLKALEKFRAGNKTSNLYETPSVGFTGGSHLLDTQFDFEKNVIEEAMHFGIRIDSCQVPSPIKRAWMKMELVGIMADREGGRPTKVQREQAKEAVEARCIAEAEKGNYLRMSETPVLWDAATETIYLGSTSEKTNDACLSLLNRAFGLEFQNVSSGTLASEWSDATEQTAMLYKASPTAFHPDVEASMVWWNGMSENYDYLGNEFLLWLWWQWETQSDKIELGDGSLVEGMFARTLSLDCPQGEHGKESISSLSPVALPEAAMAIRMGKMPRRAGLTLVRNDLQFDLTLQCERFSFGSAKITPMGDGTELKERGDRIENVRQLAETVDLLFEAFCEKRIGSPWKAELKQLTTWLQKETPTKRQKAA